MTANRAGGDGPRDHRVSFAQLQLILEAMRAPTQMGDNYREQHLELAELLEAEGKSIGADRGWALTSDSKMVRLLLVNRYDQDGSDDRLFAYRLTDNDPRHQGRQFSGNSQAMNDFLGTLPYGQWIELVWS